MTQSLDGTCVGGNWCFVALAIDGTQATFFKNFKLTPTFPINTFAYIPLDGIMIIGGDGTNDNNFKGAIKDVRILNKFYNLDQQMKDLITQQ